MTLSSTTTTAPDELHRFADDFGRQATRRFLEHGHRDVVGRILWDVADRLDERAFALEADTPVETNCPAQITIPEGDYVGRLVTCDHEHTTTDFLSHAGRIPGTDQRYAWPNDPAALRSAPVATEQHGKHCARYHAPGERCIGTGSKCGYCGVPPAGVHRTACTRPTDTPRPPATPGGTPAPRRHVRGCSNPNHYGTCPVI